MRFVKLSLHLFNADQPEITTHPVSTLITEGGGLLLTCNATGNPTPSISWIKGGSSITTGDDPRIIFGADSRTFTITNVSRADDGQYVCVASNTIGNVTSNNATLDVQCMLIVLFRVTNLLFFSDVLYKDQNVTPCTVKTPL